MSGQTVKALVAVDGHVNGELVERVIGDPRVAVSAVGDPSMGWPSREDAEALLVVCRDESEEGLELVRRAHADYPGRPVVVACEGSPNGFLRKAFRAGAEDVVSITTPDQTAIDTYLALAKAVARRDSDKLTATEGRVITVLGPKGGTGKTLVSTNLAAALSSEHQRAVVIDLDLQFGDVGLAMGLRPERTLYDLAMSGGSPDATKLEGYIVDHVSGAGALLAPTRPDQAASVTPDSVRELIRVLRASTPFVVIDTPPAFSPEVIAALDESTDICMVTMLDAPSLKNTKIALETLQLLGVQVPVRLVLNRSDSNVGISHADVVAILGRAPDVLVPSSREVVRSVNAGEPIVTASGKRNEPAKALRALAGLYLREGS
ncbi:AAA family ATPase [Paraconexibacter antarcticus]|uniref:AAA family ATPase n=1 Tax=Paraconexibacter antarcticus TaxID=2949664 RepID=A0ABY5DXN8_9ACTN|nr:AAA family ATPase [Paraconexibacter antarcticus]UTI65896.1 AAA family ATPase [Paraconexibacter antarcticus]